jgi:Do/DeqQ family serine protease
MSQARRSFLFLLAFAVLPVFPQRSTFVDSFSPLVKKTQPAVVNINTTVVRRADPRMMPDVPDFFDFFGFGAPGPRSQPRERRGESLGSGVIVRADGHILTNNHVIEGATDINVSLADGRELKAKLIGGDPLTDIAVIKVDATNLPFLPLGDSDKAEIGDVVLALGNPFGIGQTVTMGIIGALGRHMPGSANYEDFIQTDAAINPGNSGGALINTRGELIGINTAIISRTGTNAGVGFAVPSNMARSVMEQLIKTGTVSRGYIGVSLQEITPELAKGFGMKETKGVAITSVEANSPGEKAGLRAGDVILAVDGQPVEDLHGLRLRVSQTAPGTAIKLRVLRETGRTEEVAVTLAQLPGSEARAGGPGGGGAGGALNGVKVEELTPQVARQLGIPRNVQGVIVSDVDPSSSAAEAGLQRGDVIQSVNREPVTSVADFNRLVQQAGNRTVVLFINRGGRGAFLAIEPPPAK